ncbi:MAG: lytic transglycosylase domain-containing protein [Treponema sp.]|nr:lytic transglycosylase domain-containing protein [Treponema sp.]
MKTLTRAFIKAKKRSFYFTALLFLLLNAVCLPSSAEEKKVLHQNLGFSGYDKPKVKELREKYLTSHNEWLKNLLLDAENYRIYVRKEIAKRKMPLILEYLPVVESNYLCLARSKSGAAGMWQFMLNSVEPFLVCNEYIDERLDPWKSTDAALSKLTDNYNMFGDWLLAITAYNCGAGALKRAIKAAGKSDFWYLMEKGFLSEQASSYVPKLLAIADVVENDAFYGVSMPQAKGPDGKTLNINVSDFDYVTVRRSLSLKNIAWELRMDYEDLKSLNYALVKEVTPPKKEYKIRFPLGMGESARYVINNMD